MPSPKYRKFKSGNVVTVLKTVGIWIVDHGDYYRSLPTVWLRPEDSSARDYAARLPYGMLHTPTETVSLFTLRG